jgi:S1-C subfamily serine protease
MHRFTRFLAIPAVLLLLSARSWGEEPSRLPDAVALEQAMEEAIARAEPSIACIIVSHSEKYAKLSQGPDVNIPGKLNGYNPPPTNDRFNWQDPAQRGDDEIRQLNLSDPQLVPESFGSGVVIDPSGLILTHYHVVRDATKLFVRLPSGKGSYADIHAADWRSDLAVLKLLDPPTDLKAIRKGDGGKVRKGQFVLSLANPFAAGFRDGSPSASWGILSNIRRRPPGPAVEEERIKTLSHYGILLQLDARLNLGCSGGALIDLQGELIGLTTAQAAIVGGETPGGFAVPLDASMWRIVEKLRRGEEIEYGFLGVSFDPPSADANHSDGVLINYVLPNSPAANAEKPLRPQDRIIAINGIRVRDTEDLFLVVGTQLAGSEVSVQFVRALEEAPQTTTVTLAKLRVPGKSIVSSRPEAPAGLRVDWASVQERQLGFDNRIPDGVVIREVVPGSPADRAKLRLEKLITRVNDRWVKTPAEFYDAMKKSLAATGSVTVWINSESEPVALKVR